MKEVVELLRRHASVREFASGEVPEEEWATILAAGQQASTDATGQLYSAIEVRNPALRERMASLSGDQAHVRTAPRFLVVCLDIRRLRLLLEHRGERLGIRSRAALLFGITDAALFGQNVAMAAESLGYGICFIGGVQNHAHAIANELGLPPGVVPLWGFTLGRPARRGSPKPRIPRAHVVHVDRYQDPTATELDAIFAHMNPATRSGDWLNPLRRYFATGGIMEAREEELEATWQAQGLDPCQPIPEPDSNP